MRVCLRMRYHFFFFVFLWLRRRRKQRSNALHALFSLIHSLTHPFICCFFRPCACTNGIQVQNRIRTGALKKTVALSTIHIGMTRGGSGSQMWEMSWFFPLLFCGMGIFFPTN
ncbi:hypothetical protein BX661DRAFT_180723 [Kickxella alabastrina]|uniref:uncharacterized protein n=1 Tax=Kickxella alabastrina TaxID=61397 RepID=UPI00221F5C7F|nr:uncharacterized protein BX661DRAFT_190023 [Kickxella alabastrina]XP_051392356.1 uncharacterized protein BX661DRAFT_180723 [Kickxella alabastrina]KAI7819655.1 hypothetical protein BX661DRAFT_190023 [Kickxella alabastrina]KAI7829914.1 hypothetical protein BX661DRAFT_180723 [Kickxella alabastrina]